MPKKIYASADEYERKLRRVMERLGVQEHHYDYARWEAWIQFRYKGSLYRFEHSVNKAQEHGQKLHYGSDCFAQLVLSLEDLARMVERGIYDLSTWIAGMKCLPAPMEVPSFFRYLRFEEIPASVEDVKARYRKLAKEMHPDVGGDPEDFKKLNEAAEKCAQWFGGGA